MKQFIYYVLILEFVAITLIGCNESRSDTDEESNITKGEIRDEQGNIIEKG